MPLNSPQSQTISVWTTNPDGSRIPCSIFDLIVMIKDIKDPEGNNILKKYVDQKVKDNIIQTVLDYALWNNTSTIIPSSIHFLTSPTSSSLIATCS